jgi:mono/diheme cytochrome c family protein
VLNGCRRGTRINAGREGGIHSSFGVVSRIPDGGSEYRMSAARDIRDRCPRLIALLALATSLSLVGCTPSDNDEAALARGREHYLSTCSTCHQPDGEGFDDVYPNLAGNPIVRLEDPDPVIEIVLHGRGGMPSFASQPSDHLAEIVTYIRHAWANGASPVTPAQMR